MELSGFMLDRWPEMSPFCTLSILSINGRSKSQKTQIAKEDRSLFEDRSHLRMYSLCLHAVHSLFFGHICQGFAEPWTRAELAAGLQAYSVIFQVYYAEGQGA